MIFEKIIAKMDKDIAIIGIGCNFPGGKCVMYYCITYFVTMLCAFA